MGIKNLFGRKSAKPAAKKAPAKQPASKATATKAPAPAAKKASAKKSAAPAKKLQPQCAALAASGVQCANSARASSKYCGSHKGYQPPARGTAHAAGKNTSPAVTGAKDTAVAGRRPAGVKQCVAKTQSGTQCKRDAVKGGKYCATHKSS